ncbi:hypothetical protein E3J74_08825 [Candidatus Bathyarchaeota archaeon]|nr:MAG: hypothetical protein E3J74_08825 [Candidatus Bathyarchaeota archaeon]
MKTRRLTVLSLILLAALLVGAIAINATAAKTLKLKVKWKPPDYLLDSNPPDPWNAEMWLTGDHDFTEIDPTTIWLEGIYSPEYDPYPSENKPRLVVPFDGYDVLIALMLKVGHMVPGGEYRVYLEITGELNDGTPFAGKSGISLLIPENPGP